MKVEMSVTHKTASGAGMWKNSRMRVHLIAPRELVLNVEAAILKALAETEVKS